MSKIYIDLENVLKEKNVSKNKLCINCSLQRTQLNNYCNNNVTRLDTDVLARLCTVLDCKIEDILEFVPNDK